MANRVLLSADGLKVSVPGANVLTADDSGLSFSSDWAQITPYLKGSLSLVDVETDFLFGRTFTNRPLMFMSVTSALWSTPRQFIGNVGVDPYFYCRLVAQRATFITIMDDTVVRYLIWDFDL